MSLPRHSAAIGGLGLVVCLTGHSLVGSVPTVATNQWAVGPALVEARAGATATSIGDGNVLVTGGRGASGPLASVELLTSNGTMVPVGAMSLARAEHTAAVLEDTGNVLIAGGTTVVATDEGTAEVVTGSVEVFDTAAAVWYPVGSLLRPRAGATAVALPEGRIAIVGGHDASGPVLEIEIYDPAAGAFGPGGAISAPRDGAAVASTRDGHIVVVGGRVDGVAQATADIIDPVGGTVATVTLTSPRTGATATTTVEDQVLIAGGSDGTTALATTEVLDPVTGNSASGASLSTPRTDHRAYLLPHNGGVLLVGGSNTGGLVGTSELVIPWVNAAQSLGPVADPRSKTAGAAGPQDGVFVVVGGSTAADAASGSSDYFGFATVKTDKDDYAPGQFVTITGTGWQPGETVQLTLHEVGTGAPDMPLDAVADAQGNIFNDFLGIAERHLGVRFYLTATGAASRAQTTFTDAQAWTLTIAPSSATASLVQSYTLTATNTSSSGGANTIACMTVDIPAVFTSLNSLSIVSAPAGKSWTAALVGQQIRLTAASPVNTNDLEIGDQFKFSITATAPATTAGSPFIWTGAATSNNNGTNCTGSGFPAPTSGQPAVTVTAANSSISGTVYNDANGNGVQDGVEAGLAGVTVTRDGTGTTSTTTNGAGLYSFSSLAGGTYSLDYTVPAGLANTGTKPLSVTVAAGATSTGNNFFAAPQHTITFAQSGIGTDTGAATVVTVNATTYTRADLPKALTFTVGQSVTYSYATPVASTSAGKRYALTTPAPSPASPFVVTGAATVTGAYKTQYQVNLTQVGIGGDSTGTVVTVDAAAKTALDLPFTTDWIDSGGSVSYAYSATVASTVASKRYTLTTPAPTPASPINVTSPLTVVGTYQTEFEVTFAQDGIGADTAATVVTVNGSPKTTADLAFSAWYASGANIAYTFSDPVASTTSGKQYVLTTPSPTPTSPFVVSGAATVTGTYKTQFEVKFAQTGIAGDSTGTVVTVNGVPKTAASLPFTSWFDQGANVSYAYADPVATSVTGKRYALTTPAPSPASPVAVSGTVTVTGTYKAQFQVVFTQSGIGGDTTDTVVTVDGNAKAAASLPFTTDWLDSGAIVTYAYSTPVTSTVAGKRYTLTTPAPAPPSPITVASPTTVTGTYQVEFEMTFAQSGLSADATGTVVTVNGTPKTFGDLSFTSWYVSGSVVNYTFASPVSSSVAGKRFVSTGPSPIPASPITVSGPASVTGAYKTQFEITFAQAGIGVDSTGTVVTVAGSPKTAADLSFTDWFDEGASVNYLFANPVASTVAHKRYALTTPDPTPATGFAVSAAVTITGAYKTQFELVFSQAGIGADSTGTVVTVAGSAKTAADLPFITDWIDSGDTVEYAYGTPVASTVAGKRYVLTAPAPAPASPITVTSPTAVTGTYKTQFELTFAQGGIGGDSSGTVVTVDGSLKTAANLPFSDWFDAGASVSYTFATPVATTSATKRYVLTSPAPAPASPVTVAGTATIAGTYKTQFELTFTQSGIGGDSTGTVVTVAGAPKAAGDLPFADWFDEGASVSYLFASPVASTVAQKRYALTTPVASPASPASVLASMTITGTYKTQYQVVFGQSGIGADSTVTVVTVDGSSKTAASLPFTTDWLDSGASVIYTYSTPVASTVAGKRYVLTTPAPGPASPITVTAPTSVTGTYKTQFELTFTQSGIGADSTGTVVTVEGSPKTALNLAFKDWYDQGTAVTYQYAEPVASTVAGKRYALTTPAPSPASPMTVTGAATVTGTYKVQFQLTFAQSGIGADSTGTVVTVAGVPTSAGVLPFSDWFDQASSVAYSYSTPVATSVDGKRYVLTTPAPSPASPFAVSGPMTVTGTYKTQFQLTFSQTGIPLSGTGSTGGNTVATIDGVARAAADLPFAPWYDQGAVVPYAFSSPISTVPVSALQYELGNGGTLPSNPITVAGPLTVDGIYSQNTFTIRYLQPIDQSSGSSYVVNTGKNGRVIPVKVEVFKNGTEIEAGTFLMKVGGSNCSAGAPTDLVTEYADAGNSNGNTNLFRWTDGFWIYNLETTALKLTTNSCYRLDVYMTATTGATAVFVSSATWAIFKPVK